MFRFSNIFASRGLSVPSSPVTRLKLTSNIQTVRVGIGLQDFEIKHIFQAEIGILRTFIEVIGIPNVDGIRDVYSFQPRELSSMRIGIIKRTK